MIRSTLAVRKLVMLALASAACVASAQNAFFPSDATLDGSNPVFGDAYVGYANFEDFLASINGTSPTITMVTGASIDGNMQTFNGSTLNIFDGTIGASFGDLLGYNSSVVNMTGGSVNHDARFQASSTFNFMGGQILDDLTTNDAVTLHISGGSIGHSLLLNGASISTISGGTVLADVWVQDASSLTMFGPDLSASLTDPNFQGGFYSQYTLFGHLVDGTDLTGEIVNVQNGSGAQFSVSTVPEPASFLALGGLALVAIRRRRIGRILD
jgi:hypothetical protein